MLVLMGIWSVVTPTTSAAVGSANRLPAASTNRITSENALAGTDSWVAGVGDYNLDAFAAYAAPASVNAGGTVDVHVASTGTAFTARLYRLGYYQDHGARLYATYNNVATTPQPACTRDAPTGLVSCPWATALSIPTDPNWISGIYLLRLDSSAANTTFVYFVIRNDSYPAAILVMEPTKTNQAYNDYDRCDNLQAGVCQEVWGQNRGESLYGSFNNEGRARAYKVSFDRPYHVGFGTGGLFTHDTEGVRWLEASGYDVSYISDVDRASAPSLLLAHPVFMVLGHDEYWSSGERDAVEAARGAAVNLAFASANESGWQIRLEDSAFGTNRVIVCYKDAALDPNPDPLQKTVTFRDLNRPENALVGTGYQSWYDDALYNAPWQVTNPAGRWYFDCTGLQNGDVVNNIVGEEWDALLNNAQTPPGIDLLSDGTLVSQNGVVLPQQSTFYIAPSGGMVFAAGSIHWSWGLMDHSYQNEIFQSYALSNDADPRIQQLMANILDRFAGYWDGTPRQCAGQTFYKTPPRPTRTPKPEPPTRVLTGTPATATPTNAVTTPGTATRTAVPGTPTSTGTPAACQSITWTNLVNVTATGPSLQKTGGVAYQWDAGAASAQSLTGDLVAQSTADSTDTYTMFGLGHTESGAGYDDIDFAVYLAGGTIRVSESAQGGVIYGPFGTYQPGDVFRVEVSSGVVRYYQNGALLYTSTHAPAFPLHFDASLSDPQARILAASLCPLGPPAGTASPTAPPTSTSVPSATPTATSPPSPTSAPSATPTRTAIPTAASATPTRTRTPGATATRTRTPGATATRTSTRTRTPTPTGTPGACQPITWTSLANVTVSGATLQKTGGVAYQWDAGAASVQLFSGDVYAQSTADSTDTYTMFGLGHSETSAGYADIDFAVYLAGGTVRVSESAQGGVIYGPFATYQPGDVFRVAVSGSLVRYYQNGALFYTSTHAPTFPLHFDASLSDPQARIVAASLCPLGP